MKALKIVGLVAGGHAIAFLLVFAIPGCRSTNRSGTPTATTSPVGAPAAYPANGTNDAALNPGLAAAPRISSAPTFDPNAPAASNAASTPGRYSPNRPANGSGSTSGSGSTPMGFNDWSVAPPPTETTPSAASMEHYVVQRGDSLWSLSRKHGVSVTDLASANNLSAKSGLRAGDEIVIPRAAEVPEAAVAPEPAGTRYTIRSGDSLSKIARNEGVTVAALREANDIKGDIVRVGDELIIPTPSGSSAPMKTAAASTPTTSASSSSTNTSDMLQYTVMPGETLGGIATRFGVKLGTLATVNNIANPAQLRAGRTLSIPGWKPTTPVPAPTTATPAPATVATSTPATTSQARSPISSAPLNRAPNPPAANTSDDDVPTLRLDGQPQERDLDEGLDTASEPEIPILRVESNK